MKTTFPAALECADVIERDRVRRVCIPHILVMTVVTKATPKLIAMTTAEFDSEESATRAGDIWVVDTMKNVWSCPNYVVVKK